jgi:hypothetical protein
MRLASKLPAMTPGEARLPMKPAAAGKAVDCAACHGAHRFDVVPASVESCTGCHDDGHTRAYAESAHARLRESERDGRGAPGTGVSCASCHLPRDASGAVLHNQSANLRPSSGMAREVCATCHGMDFSLSALADAGLTARNFRGRPQGGHRSFEWIGRFLDGKKTR